MNLSERFWSKVDVRGKDNCWEWQASTFGGGYGAFGYNGKIVGSNRMSWFLTFGEFPDLWVLHTCDNRKCCNPNHLFLGTPQNNSTDMKNKGRCNPAIGERNGQNKLSKEDVLYIFHSNERHYLLARKFNVNQKTIRDIKNKNRWRHLLINEQ